MVDFDSMQDDSAAPAQPQAQPQTQPSGDFDSMQDDSEKYSTTGQQIKAGLEGVAQGIAGPLAPMIEHSLAIPNEDIRGRAEQNPITHGIGEAAGLVGGALTGTGEAALMEGAGKAAAEAAGLAAPVSYAAKVGSSAVRQAAEMAILQGSDETSKMILQDPNTSAESAIANIGLAAALGGAGGAFITGAVSPLWKATVGDRAESFLNSLTSKLGGVEDGTSVSADLAAKAGIDIPTELAAKIEGNPTAESAFSKLSQTDTTRAGKKLQQTISDFHQDIGDKMAETLGVESGAVDKIPELDKYTSGQKIGESLHDDLQERVKPIDDAYDDINTKFKASEVTQQNKQAISDAIANKALEQGWHKAADDSQISLMNKVMEKMPEQQTAEDLKKFITNLRDAHPYGKDTYMAAKDISKILSEGQERAVTEGIVAKGGGSEEAAQTLQGYSALKGQYRNLMDSLDNLNEHLHVGRYDGPKSFLNSLKEMTNTNAEGVLNRLSGKNKAQALEVLGQVSPKALGEVKNYHVENLIRSAKDSEGLNPYKLSKKFNELTPQIKGLISDETGQSRMQALSEITERMKDSTHNWSNTGRTADKLSHGNPTPLMLLATMMGHGGSAILGHLGSLGFKEGNDALKLAMLRYLGTAAPVKAEGFGAMASFLNNTIKGQTLLTKGVSNVLKSGAQVLSGSQMPNKADTDKLDKIVTKTQADPQHMFNLTQGKTGEYLPEHGQALTQSTARTIQYLQGLKPQPYRPNPLDSEIEPSPTQMARYNRALGIAQQPMSVLQHVKDGTLQASDIQDLNAMYPGLYQQMSQKLSNEMTSARSNQDPIPYRTRIGMSLFLGQPLDSSMQPMSIISAQPVPKPQPNQGIQKPKKGTSTLGKSNKSYQTPSQNAESDRSERD
jgi:hypothetical protein